MEVDIRVVGRGDAASASSVPAGAGVSLPSCSTGDCAGRHRSGNLWGHGEGSGFPDGDRVIGLFRRRNRNVVELEGVVPRFDFVEWVDDDGAVHITNWRGCIGAEEARQLEDTRSVRLVVLWVGGARVRQRPSARADGARKDALSVAGVTPCGWTEESARSDGMLNEPRDDPMARYRHYSVELKRQVVETYLGGERLMHALARSHDLSRTSFASEWPGTRPASSRKAAWAPGTRLATRRASQSSSVKSGNCRRCCRRRPQRHLEGPGGGYRRGRFPVQMSLYRNRGTGSSFPRLLN